MAEGYLTYKIEGLAELNSVLKAMPKEISKNIMKKALRKGAVYMRDKIREKAPIGKLEVRGNNLKRIKKGKQVDFIKLVKEIDIKNVKTDGDSMTVAITTGRAYWGMFYEFGTSKQSPKPFMRPAFDSAKDQASQIIINELHKGVMKSAEKLVGKYYKSGMRPRG